MSSLPSKFSNVDRTSCLDDIPSTGGFGVFFCPNFISRSAGKHATVSRSSTDTENKIVANATAELIWIEALFRYLGVSLKEITMPLECQSWCRKSCVYAHTKHNEIDYHFVVERVANKLLDIKFISNKDQRAHAWIHQNIACQEARGI